MKKNDYILIAGLILVGLLIIKSKRIAQPVIKPGDKSNEVYGLQNALSSLTGLKFSNMGAYDNDTLNAVRYYMNGTNALVNYEKGHVSKKFASDLWIMQSKTNKT